MSNIEQTAALLCHPSTPTAMLVVCSVTARATQSGRLEISYRLVAHTSQLKIPSPRPTRRAEGLWQHTCFEAFIAVDDGPAYYEYNFSPSGEWAGYAFENYRIRGALEEIAVAPEIVSRHDLESVELTAVVRIDDLALVRAHDSIRLGLSAVVETSDGTLSYWALKHPVDKPDFHHPDSFALELALPR